MNVTNEKPEQKKQTDSEEIRLNKGYNFVNPLLDCVESLGNYKYPAEIEEKVTKYINAQKANKSITSAAVYYRDLNNGPWLGIDDQTLFTPASLIKVPLMITYLKKSEADPTLLTKKLKTVTDVNTISDVYIKPNFQVAPNTEYSVQELINSMIINSDNIAYKTLKDNLTLEEFNKTFNDFGIDIEKIEARKDENVLSIVEYSSFFRILFNASYLNKDLSEKALELLSKSTYKDGIVAGVPSNVLVAHKFGERYYANRNEKQLHDCGIVYKSNSPYLVCIMTRGSDFDNLKNTIKNISKIIYESL